MKTRKHVVVFAVLVALIAADGFAEEENTAQGFSASYMLTDLADNFGIGLGVQSPLFFSFAAIRVDAFAFWLNAPESAELWYPFLVVRAGLAGYSFIKNQIIRLYGYGGAEFVFPTLWTDYIDTEQFRFGGFGGFGFEFFFMPHGCYYIELGSTGSGAKTRFDTRLYRNGFEVLVGMRWYF
ncbi:MAG TPA: hypothetical protein PLV76_04880 [Spirochaetales bacterium]|nr:hypothetical protein [Spirochaetales bacterium]